MGANWTRRAAGMGLVGVCAVGLATAPQAASKEAQEPRLGVPEASHFAALALKCVRQEYPNKLDHVMGGAGDVQSPRALHPAFYGCFDWHSAVHGHWMLAKLLRTFPTLPEAAAIRGALNENLAPERVAVEVAYFARPQSRSFERTYGWAWLLKLAAELKTWDDPDAQRWSTRLQPLAQRVREAMMAFLPRQTYPIRTGLHPNTAYTLALTLDYARAFDDTALEKLVVERARTYYAKDRQGPLRWEPSSEDFLSPTLEEAALMAKVLPMKEFQPWLKGFLPELMAAGNLDPAKVSDRTDPRIVHLDGLNLSRARNLYVILEALKASPAQRSLLVTADRHAEASLPFIASGSYEGEHWLGTFAVHMLDARNRLMGSVAQK